MAEPEDLEEELFADLYEGDENETEPSKPVEAPAISASSEPVTQPITDPRVNAPVKQETLPNHQTLDLPTQHSASNIDDANTNREMQGGSAVTTEHGFTGTVGMKEDGKMFIGGLNWETDDQSLRDYFSQFGEVLECTVMRDGPSGRSRGFGFLTFKDPKTVNIVMVKEHHLDGKIIDPKRAIPRDEQEKTAKIFVGGVSQEATEKDFEEFFGQFGRVIDATLMMDKDTGRPRGFGFVTFEGEQAVELTLARPLEIMGKPIEVKRAQPRGNLQNEDELGGSAGGRGGRFAGRGGRGGYGNRTQGDIQDQGQHMQGGSHGMQNGMSPQMMAMAWQRMQQYFTTMQQQMAAMQQGGQQNPMMQQMMMQQMMQQQQQQQQGGGRPDSSNGNSSPGPNGMSNMNSQIMQQMMQQQQGSMSPINGGQGNRPPYAAQDQMMFEQRKYEQQVVGGGNGGRAGSQGSGTPTSWEGMYDDVPQPNAGVGRGGRAAFGRGGGTPQPSQAPLNAPTGPKNAGRPGANYRGGGRGGHRGFHPYSRH